MRFCRWSALGSEKGGFWRHERVNTADDSGGPQAALAVAPGAEYLVGGAGVVGLATTTSAPGTGMSLQTTDLTPLTLTAAVVLGKDRPVQEHGPLASKNEHRVFDGVQPNAPKTRFLLYSYGKFLEGFFAI